MCAEFLSWIAAVFFAVSAILRVTIVPVLDDYWSGATRDREALDRADELESAGANVFSYGWIVFLVTVVLLMILWFRVLNQARVMGAHFEFGTGWAIGSWFIPIGGAVLTALVAATVIRVAAWRGVTPIGTQWRTSFPLITLVPASMVGLSVALNGIVGSIERDSFGPDALAQTCFALSTGVWVIALTATALVVRRIRRQLASGPMVASPASER
jgi:hypothetical protein